MPYVRGRDRLKRYLLLRAARHGRRRVRIRGLEFALNLHDGLSQHLYLYRDFPGDAWRALEAVTQPGMTVLDIGANIGYTTLLCGRATGPTGTVVAFEPSGRAFESLVANARLNRQSWVRTEQLACGDLDGVVDLHVAEISDEYSSLRPPIHDLGTRVERCPIIRLETYLEDKGIGPVDLIKIDVEGAEWQVLRGLGSVLTSCEPPVLLVEAFGTNTRRFDYTPPEMFDWLQGLGYSLQSLVEGHIEPYASTPLLDPAHFCDVICVPDGRQNTIADLDKSLK